MSAITRRGAMLASVAAVVVAGVPTAVAAQACDAPNQARSRWDVLHPGRAWALKFQERSESAEQIQAEVIEHLRSMPIPESEIAALFDEPPGAGGCPLAPAGL